MYILNFRRFIHGDLRSDSKEMHLHAFTCIKAVPILYSLWKYVTYTHVIKL